MQDMSMYSYLLVSFSNDCHEEIMIKDIRICTIMASLVIKSLFAYFYESIVLELKGYHFFLRVHLLEKTEIVHLSPL